MPGRLPEMDVNERIRHFLEKEPDKLPWAHGCDPEKISEEALVIWELLTEPEKLLISCNCSLKRSRNRILSDLKELGVKATILSEMSGLSFSYIAQNIKLRKVKHG